MVKIRHLGRALLGLVALFAFSMEAKADVTLPTVGSTYIIHSYNRSGVLTANADNSGVVHDVFVPKSSYWTIETDNNSTDVTAGVYLKNGDGYYITQSRTLTQTKSADCLLYIYSYSSRTTTPASGCVISTSSGQPVTENNVTKYKNCFDASNTSTNVSNWANTSDDSQGTTWVFEDVTSSTSYDSHLNYLTPDQTKVYTVKAFDTSRGGLYCASDATQVITSYGQSVADTEASMQFAFIRSEAGNLYMYSVGAKGFISYNATSNRWDITQTPQSTSLRIIPAWTEGDTQDCNYPFVIQGGNSWVGLNLGSGQTTVCGYGTGRFFGYGTDSSQQKDGGNKVSIKAVDNVTFTATDVLAAIKTYEEVTIAYNELQTVITKAEAYTTTTTGELYKYSETTSGTLATALAAAKKITTSNTATEITTAKTNLEDAIAALTFNVPPTGKFYRIKNTAKNIYLAATNASNDYAGFDATASTSNIFYYDENYHLVNYSTGYRVADSNTKLKYGGVNDAVAITLKAPTNGAAGCCNVCYTSGSRNERLYISSTTTTDNTTYYWANNLDYGDTNASFINTNMDNFVLEEVTEIPVTIGTSGYGTLYTPVPLTIPSGTSVYTGTISTDKTAVELTAVTGTIPEKETVLVAGTAGATVNFTVTTSSDDVKASASNVLKGQTVSIAPDGSNTYYTLQTIGSDSGFAKFNGTVLKGFKGYILNPDLTQSQEPGSLSLRFNDATGINAINAATENGDATIYDLQGRRVQNAVRGLYLVNGKKVFVK